MWVDTPNLGARGASLPLTRLVPGWAWLTRTRLELDLNILSFALLGSLPGTCHPLVYTYRFLFVSTFGSSLYKTPLSGHRSRSVGVRAWRSGKDPRVDIALLSLFSVYPSSICLSVSLFPLPPPTTAKWLSVFTTFCPNIFAQAAAWVEVAVLTEILNLVGFRRSAEGFAGVRQIRMIWMASGDIWLSLSDSRLQIYCLPARVWGSRVGPFNTRPGCQGAKCLRLSGLPRQAVFREG